MEPAGLIIMLHHYQLCINISVTQTTELSLHLQITVQFTQELVIVPIQIKDPYYPCLALDLTQGKILKY